MTSTSLLIFCKLVIGLVFARSSLAKARQFQHFVDTLRAFRLLPPAIARPAATCVLVAECLIVVLLFAWPLVAFTLALCMLTLFTLALAAVLRREIQTPCNCFGSSKQVVSRLDLVRNGNFLVCALGGCWIEARIEATAALAPWSLGLIALAALCFVTIWTQVHEIQQLLGSH